MTSVLVCRAMGVRRGIEECIMHIGRRDEGTVARCCVCAAVIVVYKVWKWTEVAVVMLKEWCALKVKGLIRAKRRGVEFRTGWYGGLVRCVCHIGAHWRPLR